MPPGITWYDVLGVLPGATAGEIRSGYDGKARLLRPEFLAGAPSTVVTAATRAKGILDAAWRVLGDPPGGRGTTRRPASGAAAGAWQRRGASPRSLGGAGRSWAVPPGPNCPAACWR